MPMITGAIKEGAQKLLSVFTKSKTETSSLGEPKDVTDAMDAQSDLLASPPKQPDIGQREDKEPSSAPALEVTPSSEPEPAPTPEATIPEDTQDQLPKPTTPNIPSEPTVEQPTIPQSPLPDLPEWPKAVMESSGLGNGSSFNPFGSFSAAPQPSAGAPQTPQAEAASNQQAGPSDQLPGMMPAEQVVGGYSRTDRLLELIMLRGIPTLKPPRGP